MSARHRVAPDEAAPDIRVIAGDPTPSELAAVTAVISAMAQDLADAVEQAAATGQTGWQRSQRPIRQPFQPGQGTWRGGA